METNNFALYQGKIVYVPDVPKEPITITCNYTGDSSPCVCAADAFSNKANRDVVDYYDDNCPKRYQQALQSAIANGIEVENQKEIKGVILERFNVPYDSGPFPLQCRVEMRKVQRHPNPELWETVARVTFDEQPEEDNETKSANWRHKKDDVAPTQIETYAGTLHIGGDALGWQRELDKWIDNEKRGIPPISGREKTWRLRRSGVIEPEAAAFDEQPEKETANAILNKFCTRFQADSPIEEGRPLVVTVTEALKAINFALCQQPEAAGQEQEDDLIEIVRLAYHALGKIRSEPTMSGTRYFPIPKEFGVISLEFHEKLDAFCSKYKHLVDKITRKP